MMLKLNRFTSLVFLLLSAILLLACIFFNFNWNPFGSIDSSLLLRRKIPGELADVLKKASMPDRTVILTSINEAWAAPNSVIDLFLESFRVGEGTQHLLDHLVIIAMDEKASDRCKYIHQYCYSLRIKDVNLSAEKRFMSPDYLKWMWKRVDFLRSVLELGYNFVFTISCGSGNPFLLFPRTADITMATDVYTGNSSDLNNKANAGFSYVQSNLLTVEFYKYWYMAKSKYPGKNEQVVFDIIKNSGSVIQLGLRISFLDPAYFGGFCQRPNFDNVRTMHANCCIGMGNKLHDLRLVLEDWKNFTALSADDTRKGKLAWRAPSKCKI